MLQCLQLLKANDFLFLVGERPSSQTTPPVRGENEKADVTMGTPVMPTTMGFQNSAGMNGVPQPWVQYSLAR